MFEGWENFYLIVGPSAAALIGLMFVVVTLTSARDRQQLEMGKHFYTSPIVWHLAAVLLLSGAAVAPTIDARLFGAACGFIAVIGLVLGIRSSIGIWRERITGPDSFFDMWWYGIIPAGAYVGLGAAAAATLTEQSWSASAVAAALMVLLLVSIHAEWDLVTFLAPMAKEAERKRNKTER